MASTKSLLVTCIVVLVMAGSITARADNLETATHKPCQPGWFGLHRGCYLFSQEQMNWNDAREACAVQHAELTSIQSFKEKNSLQAHLLQPQMDSEWWVGLERQATRGTDWRWLSNDHVDENTTPWRSSKIKGRPGNVCGMVDMRNGHVQLTVQRCSYKKYFICEFHEIPTSKSSPAESSSASDPSTDLATAKPNHLAVQAESSSESQPTVRPCPVHTGAEGGDSERPDWNRAVHQPRPEHDAIYRNYLQSEINANNAKVAYYSKVSSLYEEAIKTEMDYFKSYKAKMDEETRRLQEGHKCP